MKVTILALLKGLPDILHILKQFQLIAHEASKGEVLVGELEDALSDVRKFIPLPWPSALDRELGIGVHALAEVIEAFLTKKATSMADISAMISEIRSVAPTSLPWDHAYDSTIASALFAILTGTFEKFVVQTQNPSANID